MHVYVCARICAGVHACMCVCMCMHALVCRVTGRGGRNLEGLIFDSPLCVLVCLHICMCICVHALMCTCMQAYMCVYMDVCMHAHACMCGVAGKERAYTWEGGVRRNYTQKISKLSL